MFRLAGMMLLSATMMTAPLGHALQVHGEQGGKHMTAKGSFEVKITPGEVSALEKEAGIARYSLEKTFSGEMEGTGQGVMLSSFTESSGAMAYVAMDHLTVKIGGKAGSFYLAHTATMTKGDAASGVMKVVVVKNSGTGELTGISGELKIIVDGAGKHFYELEYELPGKES